MLHKDGFARVILQYDERCNVTEIACFGVDRLPVRHNRGFARYAKKYDERGNVTEESYYGVDDQLVLHNDGCARFTKKYDERGNVTEESYYGVDNQPVLHNDGYARFIRKHDERGNVTEESYYGVDNQPVLHRHGFARAVAVYNPITGNQEGVTFFGIHGKAVNYFAPAKAAPTEVVVVEALTEGQAQTVGILPGDILISYAGVRLERGSQLLGLTARNDAEPVELEVLRGSERKVFWIKPEKLGIRMETRPTRSLSPVGTEKGDAR